jgi:hypothetical protein
MIPVEKLQRMHKIVTSLPFEIQYAAYLRHDLIYAHKETAKLLRESGLRAAIFGIESLNHESAKAIGKGLHPEKIKELLYWLRDDVWKDEVAMSSGFIVGLPHDTKETILNWSEWLYKDDCPLDSFAIHPLAISKTSNKRIWKSEFELNAEKYGYTLGDNGNWSNDSFTKISAVEFSKELLSKISPTRFRCAGFSLVMLANLGYDPKDLIGKISSKTYNRPILDSKKLEYVEAYKNRLFNNKLSIKSISQYENSRDFKV